MAVHQEGGQVQRHQVQDRLVVQRTFLSKVAVRRLGLSVAERPRQRARARRNVLAENNEDNLDSVSQAHRQPVAGLAKRKAQESRGDLGSINLQPRRLLVRAPANRGVEKREARVPMVNLVGSLGLGRLPQPLGASSNRSAERKRERGLHRQGHNNSGEFSKRLRTEKSGAAFLESHICRAFAAANAWQIRD
jgi:hypothetical protein